MRPALELLITLELHFVVVVFSHTWKCSWLTLGSVLKALCPMILRPPRVPGIMGLMHERQTPQFDGLSCSWNC